MTDYAIKVENLGKQYHIGGLQTQSRNLRDTLGDMVLSPLRRTRDLVRGRTKSAADLRESFWALKDVSFDVPEGEVLGIIGHNGAGKSTLLKLLTRITLPTEGRITTYGRIGSLLEVGTGFHPELTGRENIFLNGSILGMSQREVTAKFSEIVDFAGVEQFIDTPVKHYSSGMRVRLAFAVAAHLEPEIMLIDEVLAVGDVSFQNKSMGKMSEVARSGRTVVFVSHNMGAINNLCDRVILLEHGRIRAIGTPPEMIPLYLESEDDTVARLTVNDGTAGVATLNEVAIRDLDGNYDNNLDILRDFVISARVTVESPIESSQVALSIVSRATGVIILTTTHMDKRPLDDSTLMPGVYDFDFTIPGHFLNEGAYTFNMHVWGVAAGSSRSRLAAVDNALNFIINETGSVRTKLFDHRRSLVIPLLDCSVTSVDEPIGETS